MDIKRLQINVFNETIKELTNGSIKSIEGDCQNIHVTINVRMNRFLIILFDKNKKNDSDKILLNSQISFSNVQELLNVIEMPKDDLLYLLKINIIPDVLKKSYNKNLYFHQGLVNLNNYNPYLDVLYTNFLNNTDFIELCLKIIHMYNSDKSWQNLFKSKCDYAGYEIKVKKYNIDEIEDLDTNTITEIVYKVFVITSIFLKRNRKSMEDNVFKRLSGIATRTYSIYLDKSTMVL